MMMTMEERTPSCGMITAERKRMNKMIFFGVITQETRDVTENDSPSPIKIIEPFLSS